AFCERAPLRPTLACAVTNSTSRSGHTSASSPSVARAWGSIVSTWTPGPMPTSKTPALIRTVPGEKIIPAASAVEEHHGEKNHHGPVPTERHLARRQGLQRSANSRKHWNRSPEGGRAVPDTPAGKAEATTDLWSATDPHLA